MGLAPFECFYCYGPFRWKDGLTCPHCRYDYSLKARTEAIMKAKGTPLPTEERGPGTCCLWLLAVFVFVTPPLVLFLSFFR